MTHDDADKVISAAKEECMAFGKPTVEQMLDAARHSAHHFECAQTLRLIRDLTRWPDMCAMQHVVNLDSLGQFLDAVQMRPQEVARRLNAQRRP